MSGHQLNTVPTEVLAEELLNRVKRHREEIREMERIMGNAHLVVRGAEEKEGGMVLEEGDSITFSGYDIGVHFSRLEFREEKEE